MFKKDELDIEKKEGNNKKYIIYSLIIVALVISIFYVKSIDIKHNYILLSDDVVLEYKNKEFFLVDKKNMNLNNRVYSVYSDGKFYGKHYLASTGNYKMEFEKGDSNKYTFNTGFIGVTDLSVSISYEKLEIAEIDFRRLTNSLNKNFVESINAFSSAYKINLDYDNDELMENLYFLNYDNGEDSDFSMIVYEKSGNLNIISQNSNIDSEDFYNITNYVLHGIIDVNGDNRYELVFANYTYDTPTYSIYSLDTSNYYRLMLETKYDE